MCTYMHTCLSKHVHMHTHTHLCAHVHSHAHTCTCVPACTCMHVYTQAHKRTCMCSCARIHASQEGSHSGTAVLAPGAGVWLRLVFSASLPHPPHPRAKVPTYLDQSVFHRRKESHFLSKEPGAFVALTPLVTGSAGKELRGAQRVPCPLHCRWRL